MVLDNDYTTKQCHFRLLARLHNETSAERNVQMAHHHENKRTKCNILKLSKWMICGQFSYPYQCRLCVSVVISLFAGLFVFICYFWLSFSTWTIGPYTFIYLYLFCVRFRYFFTSHFPQQKFIQWMRQRVCWHWVDTFIILETVLRYLLLRNNQTQNLTKMLQFRLFIRVSFDH